MQIIPAHFKLSNKEIISGAIRIPDHPEYEYFEYYSASRKVKLVFQQPGTNFLEIKAESYISPDLSSFEAELLEGLLKKLTEIGCVS
ncbi:hypothetical protein [Desertivirga arenae]|uniref:hypothetical protein n=1 Tax=Desertivirga arenae TaxID=2810309 RepID=UPI001A972361|nr:hypothetical protein [Pedobacter sp. SYSU D00823]